MTALALPDVPRWVEAHGIAADPASWRRELGGGFAVGHDAAALIVVAGEADPGAVAALAGARPRHTILVAIERDQLVTALRAAGRPVQRALLHTLPDPATLPEVVGAAPLPLDAALDHLSSDLARELGTVRTTRTVWAAWVDGLPASFAYAPWRSPAWFDVSVDTVPTARQLGLATIVATAMIRAERADGREPVWGADEDNAASRALAHRLGFELSDELWIAPPAASATAFAPV